MTCFANNLFFCADSTFVLSTWWALEKPAVWTTLIAEMVVRPFHKFEKCLLCSLR
jgi:hypothetical protein